MRIITVKINTEIQTRWTQSQISLKDRKLKALRRMWCHIIKSSALVISLSLVATIFTTLPKFLWMLKEMESLTSFQGADLPYWASCSWGQRRATLLAPSGTCMVRGTSMVPTAPPESEGHPLSDDSQLHPRWLQWSSSSANLPHQGSKSDVSWRVSSLSGQSWPEGGLHRPSHGYR